MTLQLLHSEFPYIWGKFDILFLLSVHPILQEGRPVVNGAKGAGSDAYTRVPQQEEIAETALNEGANANPFRQPQGANPFRRWGNWAFFVWTNPQKPSIVFFFNNQFPPPPPIII